MTNCKNPARVLGPGLLLLLCGSIFGYEPVTPPAASLPAAYAAAAVTEQAKALDLFGNHFELVLSAGGQYSALDDFNDTMQEGFGGVPYNHLVITQSHLGVFAGLGLKYRIDGFFFGLKTGIFSVEPINISYDGLYGFSVKFSYAPGMVPVEAGMGYVIPFYDKASNGAPWSLILSLYTGYAKFSMSAHEDIKNSSAGTFVRDLNFYAESACGEFSAAMHLDATKQQPLTGNIGAGYRLASASALKTDKEYSVVSSTGETIITYKGTTFFQDIMVDLSGIFVDVNVNYAF
jgi:hypothetical protein